MVPHGMSFEAFKQLLDEGKNEALNEIGDVVHLDAFKDTEDIANELSRFLDNEGNARRYYAYTKALDLLRIAVGALSAVVLTVCTLLSFGM
jgi:hypothetical protein